MTNDITAAIETALRRVSDAASLDEIDAVSGETLGKKGVLGGLKASLANIDDLEERKAVGRSLNEGFASVSAAIDERRQELIAVERASQVAGERLDLTEGILHPEVICISSHKPGKNSKMFLSVSASPLPRAQKWRPTGTTLRLST